MLCELYLNEAVNKYDGEMFVIFDHVILSHVQDNTWKLSRHCQVSNKKNNLQVLVEQTNGVCLPNNMLDKVAALFIGLKNKISERVSAGKNISPLDYHILTGDLIVFWGVINHVSPRVTWDNLQMQFSDELRGFQSCISHVCF